MKATGTAGNGKPAWTNTTRKPVSVGCSPVRPVDFHRMTPKQRKDLAARRRAEVEAARATHPVRVEGTPVPGVTVALIAAMLATLAPLVPVQSDECDTPGCHLVPNRRGLCWGCAKAMDRGTFAKRAEKIARHAA